MRGIGKTGNATSALNRQGSRRFILALPPTLVNHVADLTDLTHVAQRALRAVCAERAVRCTAAIAAIRGRIGRCVVTFCAACKIADERETCQDAQQTYETRLLSAGYLCTSALKTIETPSSPETYPPPAAFDRCSRLTMLASFWANAMRACAALEVAAVTDAADEEDGEVKEESSVTLSARALQCQRQFLECVTFF